MSKFDKDTFDFSSMREKARASREDMADINQMYQKSMSWRAVSELSGKSNSSLKNTTSNSLDFSGKVLRGGKYSGENLAYTKFSGADLKETNFVKADLEGADFTGADLSGADLSGANLNGAVFSSASLIGTNFTGAKMNGVILADADIQDAILLDVEMDNMALEELQALVEYLAIYYPHKLNLSRMNLTMLDFSRIDLSKVNLRGVDFTGVNFTGVNIFELDLSECIISPEQIAQALGRIPTPLELKQILAPKKKNKSSFKGIDFDAFFRASGSWGVWDLTKYPGISIKDLLAMGKKIYNAVIKVPDPKDEEILAQFQQKNEEKQDGIAKEHNAEMRKVIEERKKELLNKLENSEPNKNIVQNLEDKILEEKKQQQEKQEMLQSAKEKYIENRKQAEEIFQKRYEQQIAISRTRNSRERG